MPSRATRQHKKSKKRRDRSKRASEQDRDKKPSDWSIPDFWIPSSKQQLDELTKMGRVPQINELEQGAFASGSQINQVQFAALRIVFKRAKKPEKLDKQTVKSRYGLSKVWGEAEDLVEKCKPFQAYLSVVQGDKKVRQIPADAPEHPRSFKTVRLNQELVCTVSGMHDRERDFSVSVPKTRSTTKHKNLKQGLKDESQSPTSVSAGNDRYPSSEDERISPHNYPDAEDEIVPNAALILYLQEVLDIVPDNGMEWVFNRAHFTVTFRKGKYMAFTDGALRSMKGQELMSFVEVKKRMRQVRQDAILMQEGSEMVGYIMRQQSKLPNLNNQSVPLNGPFLISTY
jgi:hypothetical protein